jgi:hypothetical protein
LRLVAIAAVLLLAGCQGGEEATYDGVALKRARATASSERSGWQPGWGKPISVGQPVERELCEARTFHADPCVAVPTVHRFRDLDIHGEVYVWLAREQGHWTVVDTDYFSPEIRMTIEGGQPAPPWVSP